MERKRPQFTAADSVMLHAKSQMEVWHGVQGWFDDRVEARNALAKVGKLWQISAFDRAELPWMDLGEREGRMFNKAEV